MSNERQETVSDIVSEMRHDCPARHMDGTMYRDVDWVYTKGTVKRLADRIEAAHKREREAGAETAQICGEIGEMIGRGATCNESVTNCNQLGNAATMREAVKTALEELLLWNYTDRDTARMALGIMNKLDAALSAPPRNCDIMDWRTAWAKWQTEFHPQKPCGYAEAVSGSKQFMDWYMSEAKGAE